jgi:hypothetical protein
MAKAKTRVVQGRCLERLYEAELQFQQGISKVTRTENIGGEYVGSGVGTVEGPRIKGTMRWDLFEEREETLCRSNLVGVIDTDDGAQIRFDSRGFFIRPNETDPNKWITSASVHFTTSDERYRPLNTQLAVWEGEFDMAKLRHHYYVYIACESRCPKQI